MLFTFVSSAFYTEKHSAHLDNHLFNIYLLWQYIYIYIDVDDLKLSRPQIVPLLENKQAHFIA